MSGGIGRWYPMNAIALIATIWRSSHQEAASLIRAILQPWAWYGWPTPGWHLAWHFASQRYLARCGERCGHRGGEYGEHGK